MIIKAAACLIVGLLAANCWAGEQTAGTNKYVWEPEKNVRDVESSLSQPLSAEQDIFALSRLAQQREMAVLVNASSDTLTRKRLGNHFPKDLTRRICAAAREKLGAEEFGARKSIVVADYIALLEAIEKLGVPDSELHSTQGYGIVTGGLRLLDANSTMDALLNARVAKRIQESQENYKRYSSMKQRNTFIPIKLSTRKKLASFYADDESSETALRSALAKSKLPEEEKEKIVSELKSLN